MAILLTQTAAWPHGILYNQSLVLQPALITLLIYDFPFVHSISSRQGWNHFGFGYLPNNIFFWYELQLNDTVRFLIF